MLIGHEELRNKTLMNSGAAFLGNTLGGINERGDFWGMLLLDVIGMCSPCTGKRDGKSITGSGGIPYTQFANVESQELHYPFLYLFRRLSPDAWGHGRYRGGRSVELAFTPHRTDFIWMLLWNHGAEFANSGGVSGGLGASAVRFKHAKGSDIAERWKAGIMPQSIDDFPNEVLKAKSNNMLHPSDVIYFGVPGSSGYGDPLLREPERVLADVAEGILSPDHALRFYGVVVEGDPPEVDLPATEAARAKVRELRSTRGRYLDEWDRLVPPEPDVPLPRRSPRTKWNPPGPLRALFAVGLGLQIARDASRGHWWVCSECGHVHCPADHNPKEHVLIRVGYLSEMSHPTAEMARRDPPRFFQRQFYCPSCVLMFDNEMARAEDAILSSIEYDMGWLSSLE
jgi:N-methylhydantoinase B